MTYDKTRREFGKVAGGIGLAATAGLAGCLGDDGDDTGDDAGDDTDDGDDVDEPFRLRMWHEDYGNEFIGVFEEETGIESTNQGFESPTEPYSQLEAGQFAGDCITFLHDWGQRAYEEGLIEPIDTSRLDNLDNIDDRWQTMNTEHPFEEVPDGHQWGIPYDVDIFPLAYNDDILDEPDSWDILWDDDLNVTIQDSPITGPQIAALYTGQDPIDPDDFEEIEEALMQNRDNIVSYWPGFERGM